MDDLLELRALLDQLAAGRGAERDMAALVGDDLLEAVAEGAELAPDAAGVDDDLVRRHRQDALDPDVVERREADEALFDGLQIAGVAGVEQLVTEVRQPFVDGLAGRVAAGRIDGLLAVDPVLAQLLGVDGADDLLVPHGEELRVPRLLHHEGGEEHGPVELAEGVRRVDHRQRLVGDLLLAAEEAHGDHHDAALLLGGELLEVTRVGLVVEVARVPELPHGLLVLAVDRPRHHVAAEAKSRFECAFGLFLDGGHVSPLQDRTLKLEVIVMARARLSRPISSVPILVAILRKA